MAREQKWIYLSYIVAAFICAWVLNKLLLLVTHTFEMANPLVLGVLSASQVIAFAATGVAALLFFRQPHVHGFSVDVVQELYKVTWPQGRKTFLSTLVVLAAVLIVAGVLGFYDFVCSWLVGLLLGTSRA